MKKNITNFFLALIGILLIIEGIFIIKNSNDIKELKNQKEEQKETQWVDENINNQEYKIDKSLVGKWRANSSNIYIIDIEKDGTITYKMYNATKTQYGEVTNEQVENSEDFEIFTGYRGKLEGTTYVMDEYYGYAEKKWAKCNQISGHLYKTSDKTIKTDLIKLEFIKQ